jgi:hypothetical protein
MPLASRRLKRETADTIINQQPAPRSCVNPGRYPSGSYLPTLARGFASFERGDLSGAIEAFAPLAGQNERIGGSRAQHDLIEFTLLKAYLNANRLDEARHLLSVRRPGASGIPVEGIAAVQ